MLRWIYLLIQHYTVHPSSDSLLHHICNQPELLISTDGSRIHNKSDGSWIIALPDWTKLVSGHNLEFGRHVAINSYHSEVYASLASLTFLERYCDYSSLPLSNTIYATCASKSYVTKMKEFISNPYTKLFIHKIKEYEAYFVILSTLSVNFAINHMKGHQDNFKLRKDLTIEEQLNINSDKIATTCAKIPLNIHLPSVPLAIYLKEEYIHLPHTQ